MELVAEELVHGPVALSAFKGAVVNCVAGGARLRRV